MLIGTHEFDFSHRVYVMGILNVTPDSFSDGGLHRDPDRALDRALEMQEQGADLIDVGGESTRPGADPVSVEEELRRVVPVLRKMIPHLRVPVSIDTSKEEVARAAIDCGAVLVNDVTALSGEGMAVTVARAGVPVILMHMRGTPKTMQEGVVYDDVVSEVLEFLRARIAFAEEAGIAREKILIDPGIGFGKRHEDNAAIIGRLEEFQVLRQPVVFGASRKKFVQNLFGQAPHQVLAGSIATAALAAAGGAAVIRAHDVRETKSAITLARGGVFQ